MKKTLGFILTVCIFSAAFIFLSLTSVPSTSAPAANRNDVRTSTIYKDGMTFVVFTQQNNSGGAISIDVVNVTKDKLEVQKLKAEINYYNKIK